MIIKKVQRNKIQRVCEELKRIKTVAVSNVTNAIRLTLVILLFTLTLNLNIQMETRVNQYLLLFTVEVEDAHERTRRVKQIQQQTNFSNHKNVKEEPILWQILRESMLNITKFAQSMQDLVTSINISIRSSTESKDCRPRKIDTEIYLRLSSLIQTMKNTFSETTTLQEMKRSKE